MKKIVLLAFSGVALLAATPGLAVPIGDGCGEGAPPGCVPAKPVLPETRYLNGYFAYHDVQAGQDRVRFADTMNGISYLGTLAGDGLPMAPQPLPDTLQFGSAESGGSVHYVRPTGTNAPSVTVSAQQDAVKRGDYPATSIAGLSYLLKLQVAGAELAKLQTLIAADPAIAVAKGIYAMSASGATGQGQALMFTGFDAFGLTQQINYCFGGGNGPSDGCGTHTYTLPVSFVAGSAFQDGDPNAFYAQVGFSAAASTVSGYAGSAEVFIDPTVTFSRSFLKAIGGLPKNSVTYSVAGQQVALAAVPEPASWAMMTVGFGLIGAVRRRRRQSQAVSAA